MLRNTVGVGGCRIFGFPWGKKRSSVLALRGGGRVSNFKKALRNTLMAPSPCPKPTIILSSSIFCLVSCLRSVGIRPCLPTFFFSFSETSGLGHFAQMWLCSCLPQWPNHFSLMFSRKVSTNSPIPSFLMCFPSSTTSAA